MCNAEAELTCFFVSVPGSRRPITLAYEWLFRLVVQTMELLAGEVEPLKRTRQMHLPTFAIRCAA